LPIRLDTIIPASLAGPERRRIRRVAYGGVRQAIPSITALSVALGRLAAAGSVGSG
jgi:tetrahydromethanopterin S-methyltransferase subunit C